jgi:hypothetical protein
MKKSLTSAELAEAWKAGELPLHTAVERHWRRIGLCPVKEEIVLVLELVLGFANLGQFDRLIPVGDDEVTVRDAIEQYQLSEFLG